MPEGIHRRPGRDDRSGDPSAACPQRSDIDLLLIDEEKRKRRGSAPCMRMNAADLVFLCLPDAAAIEAVDADRGSPSRRSSTRRRHTAVRIRSGPMGSVELGDAFLQGDAHQSCASPIRAVTRPVSSPSSIRSSSWGSCPRRTTITAYSLTGYSGGGKQMIAAVMRPGRDAAAACAAAVWRWGFDPQASAGDEDRSAASARKTRCSVRWWMTIISGMATSVLLEAEMPHKCMRHWPKLLSVKGWCMCTRRAMTSNISANAHGGQR